MEPKIKHFRTVLRPTIISMLGVQKIPVSYILEDDAIIHLGKKFTDMFTLTDKIYQYLREKGNGEQIPRSLLQQKSSKGNYTTSDFFNAMIELDNMVDIGKIVKDGHVYYCWYNMTREQILEKQKQLEFFNSL